MSNDKYVNKDTYQTIQKVEVQSDFGAAIKPLWKKQENKVKEKTKYSQKILIGTHVHSDVSIHYTQALLEFQQECFKKKIGLRFS